MEGIQPYSFEPTRKKIARDEPVDESSGSDEIDINMDRWTKLAAAWNVLCFLMFMQIMQGNGHRKREHLLSGGGRA